MASLDPKVPPRQHTEKHKRRSWANTIHRSRCCYNELRHQVNTISGVRGLGNIEVRPCAKLFPSWRSTTLNVVNPASGVRLNTSNEIAFLQWSNTKGVHGESDLKTSSGSEVEMYLQARCPQYRKLTPIFHKLGFTMKSKSIDLSAVTDSEGIGQRSKKRKADSGSHLYNKSPPHNSARSSTG
ncbi:unnamed protein product [Phytophthora lilii]|uniref:Unnamed protein product n=1 Tax=Phytophthora lilii TaxID=2077276 RepID=A0A9W6XBJ0_9STRA|nr:unnamed protein product [Phytophthora lilii]